MAVDVGSQPRRIYALIRLSSLSHIFRVEKVSGVPYQSVSILSSAEFRPLLDTEYSNTCRPRVLAPRNIHVYN